MAGWSIETVDSVGSVGRGNSIALGANGYPHISYYDMTNAEMRYAYKDSAGWHLETVDDTYGAGYLTSLALNSNGFPCIAYLDIGNYDLKYAHKDDGGWHIEIVDSDGMTGDQPSLVLDGSDYPHISYQDRAANYVNYAYKDGSGWHIEPVARYDWNHNSTPTTRIALGSDGYPRIAYTYMDYSQVRYAYKDADGWHDELAAGWYSWLGGMSLDDDDYPHISYFWRNYAATVRDVRYSYKDAEGWHTEILETSGTLYYYYQDLKLDASGIARVSYSGWTIPNSELQFLKYAQREDIDTWNIETVDDNLYIVHNALALSASGQPHISYHDDTSANRDLKYAYVMIASRTYFLLA